MTFILSAYENQPTRFARLKRVVDAFYKSEDKCTYLAALHDYKGTLLLNFFEEPSIEEVDVIREAWRAECECNLNVYDDGYALSEAWGGLNLFRKGALRFLGSSGFFAVYNDQSWSSFPFCLYDPSKPRDPSPVRTGEINKDPDAVQAAFRIASFLDGLYQRDYDYVEEPQ